MHYCDDLIQLFDDCFFKPYQTRLIKGDDEPLYLPMNASTGYHAIIFAHGFFSSALHECAHWCIAGDKRRLLVDYGYWYEPDGRSLEQQQLFYQVEVKPQAIEWIFSLAAHFPFHFSLDNLAGETGDVLLFKEAVKEQVINYLKEGLPVRAQQFAEALCRFYNTSWPSQTMISTACLQLGL